MTTVCIHPWLSPSPSKAWPEVRQHHRCHTWKHRFPIPLVLNGLCKGYSPGISQWITVNQVWTQTVSTHPDRSCMLPTRSRGQIPSIAPAAAGGHLTKMAAKFNSALNGWENVFGCSFAAYWWRKHKYRDTNQAVIFVKRNYATP